MLAEQRWATDPDGRGRQLHGAADRLIGAPLRVVDVDDHLTRLEVRVGKDLAGILAGATRHAGFTQQPHHLVLAALSGPISNDGIERRAIFPARLERFEARVFRQFGLMQDAEQAGHICGCA